MNDSWLDDAIRAEPEARASHGFTARVLNQARDRSERRRKRFRFALLSTSAMAAAAASLLLLWAPQETPEVTADELAALRAELTSLRAALPTRPVAIDTVDSGELQVDMEALWSTSTWSAGGDDPFAEEGGQL
ncbi:MAG: hypothetical protein AAFY60_06140 [Myxococcota bacterium]